MEVTERSINGVPIIDGSKTGSITDQGSLNETFDNFLTLLTTQLQNQDPLSPMDTNEFTEQLVQYSSVEQALATNEKLDELIALQGGSNLNAAVGYLGKEITTSGADLVLENGFAKISYELPAMAEQATLMISNAAGAVVKTIPVEGLAGRHDVTWDGTDTNGDDLSDGTYGFAIVARDNEGETIDVKQESHARVTGVQTVDGQIILLAGDMEIPADDVTAVREITGADD